MTKIRNLFKAPLNLIVVSFVHALTSTVEKNT